LQADAFSDPVGPLLAQQLNNADYWAVSSTVLDQKNQWHKYQRCCSRCTGCL